MHYLQTHIPQILCILLESQLLEAGCLVPINLRISQGCRSLVSRMQFTSINSSHSVWKMPQDFPLKASHETLKSGRYLQNGDKSRMR